MCQRKALLKSRIPDNYSDKFQQNFNTNSHKCPCTSNINILHDQNTIDEQCKNSC